MESANKAQLTRLVDQRLDHLDVGRHLRVGVWHCVRNVDLIRGESELVLKRQLVEGSHLRVIEFIDLICIRLVVIRDILAACLVPTAFVFL